MHLLYSEISTAASVAIAALDQIGITSCFIGGMACKLYGNDRTPGGLDILCLECSLDKEELKRQVVAANPSFYLIPSKAPGSTFNSLWYRPKGSYRSCKVDLLFPGTIDITPIPIPSIDYPEPGRPCAPFTLVFLLKLKTWMQHHESSESRFRIKSSTDASDVKRMLPIALAKGVNIQQPEAFLSPSFIEEAGPRAKRFLQEWPETETEWRTLGFSV